MSLRVGWAFNAINESIGNPCALLGSLASSDETLPELAARVAADAGLPLGDVTAVFEWLADEGFTTDGAHPSDVWGGG